MSKLCDSSKSGWIERLYCVFIKALQLKTKWSSCFENRLPEYIQKCCYKQFKPCCFIMYRLLPYWKIKSSRL